MGRRPKTAGSFGSTRQFWEARYQQYVEAGVPELLARLVAGTSHLYTLLPVLEAADETGQAPADVAAAYFAVGDALELPWYGQQLSALPVENNWQALAREAFRDDLDSQQRAMTVSVLQPDVGEGGLHERLDSWLAQRQGQVERWRGMLGELRGGAATDYAMYAVASRELQDLAQAAPMRERL